ncbi:hypothetical protein FQN49_003624 [Arthroderma sp. PD_2]|nr:hypothetical protein FQN49_003624 [Arthroderma sp. PD_2]
MAERVTGDRVFCHECEHQWPRNEHGLTCPHCQSEFVEILDDNDEQDEDDGPEIQQHQPYPPRPTMFSGFNSFLPNHQTYQSGNGHVTRHHYHSNDGRFQFTSTTIRSPRGGGGVRMGMNAGADNAAIEDPLMPIFRNFNAILQGIAETEPNRGGIPLGYGYQNTNRPQNNNYRDTDPPEILGGGLFPRDANRPQGDTQPLRNISDILGFLHAAVHPTYQGAPAPGSPLAAIAHAMRMRHGDAVYSQEELDRVISELVDQNMNGGAPAAAPEEAIRALPKVKVDKSILGSDGKAECSICMDSVDLGTEVTMLPCKHWFHDSCITAWLNEHDTCPHCRQGITAAYQQSRAGTQQQNQASQGPGNGPPGSAGNPFIVNAGSPSERPPSVPNNTRPRDGASQSTEQPASEPQSANAGGDSPQPSGLSGWMRYHFGGGNT